MIKHKELLTSLKRQDAALNSIYKSLSLDLAKVLRKYKVTNNTKLWFKNADVKKEIEAVMKRYRNVMYNHMTQQIENSWDLSNKHNDGLVNAYTKGIVLPNDSLYYQRNTAALQAFLKRKDNGLNLSDRVWNLTKTTQSQLDYFIAEGLTKGRSATSLAKDLKRYLKYPDKRFRRLKDPVTGKLKLSDPAENFKPGQGVYRSSYQNALRLARNEINIAYRTADHERIKQLPFVLGVTVNLSPAHPRYDICDELQGDYPKAFKFVGWHPNCLCFTTTKLASKDDFVKQLNGKPIDASKNIDTIPNRAAKYLNENSEKIKGYKSKPYFITDNFKNTKDGFDLKNNIGKNVNIKETNLETKHVPISLENYEKALEVNINKSIFTYLNKDTELNPSGITGKGGFYNPTGNFVFTPVKSKRNLQSKWHSESIIYHEFGHAADWQNGFRFSNDVKELMNKYRKKYRYSKTNNYRDIDKKWKEKYRVFFDNKDYDNMEKTGAFADTIMSLNKAYGFGHSKAYYKQKGKAEAEFIAHAFENKFIGNDVFKELAPDLYKDMIELIELFKSKLK